ncbi:YIP1 family protein [Bacillaceae bacterium Marseille-Q3522]|nr:YIP1 family protein [Bacillaceae bacterium Marseille-Q3522]
MEEQLNKKPSLLGIFSNPGVQFERIREKPVIWLPLLIITILSGISGIISASKIDAASVITEEVPAELVDFTVGFAKAIAIIAGFLAPVIGILIASLIYIIITKIAKSDASYKQLFSMTSHIYIIGTVGSLINIIIQYFLYDSLSAVYITSLGGLINSSSPVLASIEIFSIWQLILTAIGLNKVAKLSKGVSWAVVIIFFVLDLLMGMLGQAL